jgi:hypothetical protein
MHLDVRPVSRLRGADRMNVMALLAPVVDTLCDNAIDLSRISVVCDWVQYRANFREVADFRPVLSTGWPGSADPEGEQCNGADGPGRPAEAALEIALDLRRCADADLPAVIGQLLREHADPATSSRMPLEPWVAMARSCIWRFNALYWQALSFWEQATGREYEQALQCHDLFLTDIQQYRAGFFGPGKYDGSVVNWINGPLLHRVGSRSGFDVQIAPFAGRPSSNIKTLAAQVRE